MPASYSKNLKKLENALGYTFNDIALLEEALTHSSYANEHQKEGIRDNERLEFLGDAVLGLSVVESLFRAEDRLPESEMARLKSFLVSKTVLSDIARTLSIGQFLRLGKGELRTGGRDKDNILADAMEAIFGAIYIDGGFHEAKAVILKLLKERIHEALRTREAHDFKTVLQELTQDRFGVLPEYSVVKEEGLEHKKTYVVEVMIKGEKMGEGRGRSKKEAQMMAAKKAIGKLKKKR
jgi:ribonuclease-3